MKIRRIGPVLLALFMLFSGGCAGRRTSPPVSPVSAATTASAPAQASAFQFPVPDGVLPPRPELMPGAPRDYRGGVHEGIDVYYKTGISMVSCGEQVFNCADGMIIRSDTVWNPVGEKEYASITTKLKQVLNEDYLDRLRGRQVWVRTADGITIRYCHLESVAPGITAGIRVNQGVAIGTIGNSGTADGARKTAKNCHLHLEIWMPDGKFLGAGLSQRDTRAAWSKLFGFTQPGK